MAPKYSQALSFGSFLNQKAASVEAKVAQAAPQTEMSAGAKALMFGSPEQQRAVATAQRNGNDLADPQVQDLYGISAVDAFLKYGPEVSQNLGNISRANYQVSQIENAQRTSQQVASDSAIDVAVGALGTVGGTAALGAEALDWALDLPGNAINAALGTELVPDIPSAGPAISRGTQIAREFGQGLQSPVLQAKREQLAIEQELDAADREADFADQEGVKAWFRKQGRATLETVGNYIDDPAMFGSVAAEGLGSLAVPTKIINSVGKMGAMRELAKRNMTKKEAQEYLKTDDGKAFLNKKKLGAVAPVTALTEGGGAVSQAQQEILSMSEEELSESAEYRELRKTLGHEEARYSLASDGGKASAVVGVLLGAATGRISRQFEVNPLGLPGTGKLGSSIAKGSKTAATETLEEGAQEGSNLIGSNVGVASIGLDRDITEGLGEAVGEGLVGGAGMVGVTAGPAAAAGTVAEIGRGIKDATVAAVERANQKIREEGPTGLRAQAETAVAIEQTNTEIRQIPEAERQAPAGLVKALNESTYLSPEESAGIAQVFPDLAAEITEDNPQVSRTSAINQMSQVLETSTGVEQNQMAVGIIESYDQLRRLASDEAKKAIAALPEDSAERKLFDTQLKNLKTVEGNASLAKAKKVIGSLTEENLQELMGPGLAEIEAGNVTSPAAMNTLDTLDVISRYKPQIAKSEDYTRVHDQISETASPEVIEKIEEARKTVTAFEQALAMRTTLAEGGTAKQQRSRDNIFNSGHHANSGKSIPEHNRVIEEARLAGRQEESLDNLQELYEFARSQSNKLGGMNESKNQNNGQETAFESWNPTRGERFLQTKKGQMPFLHENNVNSVVNALETAIDAKLVGDLYNKLYEKLKKTFGEEALSTFKPITITQLDLPADTRAGKYTVEDVLAAADRFDPTDTERRLRRDAMLKPSESLIDDEIKPVNAITQKRRAELTKVAGGKTPFRSELLGKAKIRPGSYVHRELLAAGFQKSDMPGLISNNKNKGLTAFDNIPAANFDPVLVDRVGTDDNGNLSMDGIIAALMEEASGNPVPVNRDQLEAIEELSIADDEQRRIDDLTKEETTDVPVQSRAKEEPKQSQESVVEEPSQPSPEESSPESRESRDEDGSGDLSDVPGDAAPAGSEGEAAADSPAVQEKARPRPLKDILVNLVLNNKGVNHFLETFKRKPREVSLLDQESPFSQAIEQADLPTDVKNALLSFAKEDMPARKAKVDEFVTRGLNRSRGKSPTLAEGLETKDVLAYKSGLVLNLGQITDGKYSMDPKVFSAGMMAMLNWMAHANATGIRKPSRKNLVEIFNLSGEGDVLTAHTKLYQKGTFLQSAVDSISRDMEQLLGVQADKNQPVAMTQGILRHAASTFLQVFDEGNLLTVNNDKEVDSVNGKNYFTVSTNKEGPFKEFLDLIAPHADLFKGIYAPDSEKLRYIGKPPPAVAESIIRQASNKISKTQRDVMKRLQKTEHYLVTPMVALSESMDELTFLALNGYKELDGRKWNASDKEAIKGRNLNLLSGLNGVRGYIDDMAANFDEDQPIFFDWRISSVGRLQQQGPVTPQGNKVVREMISSTRSTLDMTTPEHQEALMLAVAQSLDISIEKQSIAATIQEINNRLDNEYADVVEILKAWDLTGDMNGPALLKAFEEADIEKSMKSVHALLTVARLRAEEERGGDVTKFETSLALEYDGKTDGPINAMINMATGHFTKEQVEVMAKGGLLLGVSGPVSLNDYIGGNKDKGFKNGDELDLYNVAAAIFEGKLAELLSQTGEAKSLDLALQLMDRLSKNFSYKGLEEDGAEIDVKRNMVKNPLTVFIYGSSETGIAGKLAGEMVDNLRSLMSEVANDYGSYHEHPDFKGTGLADLLAQVDPGNQLLNDPENNTGDHLIEPLTKLLDATISEALTASLDEATGGIRANMQLLQATARVQAAIFADAYKKGLEAKKAELGITFKGNITLSENQLREVFEEASAVAPIYVSDVQEFRVAEADNYSSEETVSEGINGGFSSGASLPKPGDPSVKISPFLIIGTGDGMMMMNIYSGELQDLDQSLAVFDGVEDKLENIKSNSEYINEQVLKGWMTEDVPGMVLKSFNQTVRYLRKADLTQETLKDIRKTYYGLNKARLGQNPVTNARTLHAALTTMADENKARKEAMATFSMSADHMAGADAPHFAEGKILSNGGYNASTVRDALNIEFDRIRVDQVNKAKTKQSAQGVQKADGEMTKLLTPISEDTGVAGTRRVQGDALIGILENSKLTPEQEAIFADILKNDPSFKEFSFFFGSSEELTVLRDRDYPGLTDKPVQLGQTIPDKKVAYISNASPETVIHEILHSYTAARIEDYYADKAEGKHIPTYMVQAFDRLEKLMADFRLLEFRSKQDPAFNAEDRAGLTLQRQLDDAKGDPVIEMSEFLSWTLSNQNLIQLSKDTQVRSPLARIAHNALQLLKRVLRIKGPGTDMFSNIRFNLAVISRLPKESRLAQETARTRTIFDQVYGTDSDLNDIETKYLTRLRQYLSRISNVSDGGHGRTAELQFQADHAINVARSVGFQMNDREAMAFRAIHATMSSGMKLNGSVLRQAKRVYAAALEKAPENRQWDFLSGNYRGRRTDLGQTDLLATFVALSQVNNDFRAELAEMEAPPVKSENGRTNGGFIDEAIGSIGNQVVDHMTKLSISRKPLGRTAQEQMDALSAALVEIEDGRRLRAEELSYDFSERVNGFLSDGLDKVSTKATRKLQQLQQRINPTGIGKYASTATGVAALITSLGSKTELEARMGIFQEHLNKTHRFREFAALVNDIRGVTKDNVSLLRLMNLVRSKIDAMRQEYREEVPDYLASKFTRKLTDEEWSESQTAIAGTDLTAIGRQEALDVIHDPTKLPAMIRSAEGLVRTLGGAKGNKYIQKSKVLAAYLSNKEKQSNNMQKNAYAIAKLAGERDRVVGEVNEDLVEAIDKLTSLYAYDKLADPVKDRMRTLAEEQADGMLYLLGTQHTTRGMEMRRISQLSDDNVARINGWKGYSPSVPREGHSVVVINDADGEAYRRKGYEYLGPYEGDGQEELNEGKSYYVSTVGGKAAYRQGTMQTVHETWNGVDPRSGFSQSVPMGGVIKGRAAERIFRNRGRVVDGTISEGEALLPVFNNDGRVVAYERSMRQEALDQMQVDDHMGRMLGVWMGRMLEEKMGNRYNKMLLQNLKETYDADMAAGKGDQYINVAQSDDPVHRDIWRTIGNVAKDDAAEIFGEERMLPVKRDQELDALGYRAGSVREVWEDDSRLNKNFQKVFREAMVLPFGDKAYKRAVQAETAIQGAVNYAKDTIIVKSMVVMADNLISNVLHLQSWGIGPIEAIRGIINKFLETNQYVKNRERLIQLNSELAARGDDPQVKARILAQIKVLRDIEKNLSIYPLIEAGEFNTISEGLTETDLAIANGSLGDMIEGLADKLPKGVSNVVKTLMITKDSALHKVLNRAVQYGDFTAKAVLYDHLTNTRGQSQDEAMQTVTEEFVNYNRLAGRGRDYAESMGMLWFFSYKLRIMKVMAKMARDRPATALLIGAGVGPWTGTDTVFSGSAAGAVIDGRFGYAVGPEMGINALSMNPFYGAVR